MSDLSASKATAGVDKTLALVIVEASGMSVIVVVVVVVFIVVIVVIVVVARAVVVASIVLFQSIKAFVNVVELNANVIDFHGGSLGGGGRE